MALRGILATTWMELISKYTNIGIDIQHTLTSAPEHPCVSRFGHPEGLVIFIRKPFVKLWIGVIVTVVMFAGPPRLRCINAV